MYTTYILFSKTTLKYYTGHCEDIGIRLNQHNGRRNKSTKAGIPWEIVYSCEFETRRESMELEGKIKSRGAKRYINDQYNQDG